MSFKYFEIKNIFYGFTQLKEKLWKNLLAHGYSLIFIQNRYSLIHTYLNNCVYKNVNLFELFNF